MEIRKLTATLQKDYYGKAMVIRDDNGTVSLKSYDTIVCRIENGKFIKMWDGWSVTTMNHIKDFCMEFGFEFGNKKWWDNLECENGNRTRYKIHGYHPFGLEYMPTTTFDDYDKAWEYCDHLNETSNGLWMYQVDEI